MKLVEAGKFIRTISRMKPGMIASRLRGRRSLKYRSLSAPSNRSWLNVCVPQMDLNRDYLSKFDVEALLVGNFLLINERFSPDLEIWDVPDASHLWNFNLHYFEYGIALGAAYVESKDAKYWLCFKSLVESWIRVCTYSRGDAWHPYTISLRLVNWLICRSLFVGEIEGDKEFDDLMSNSMYLQYRHLFVNQETHLLANHYFENLKTLVIFSEVFKENDVFASVWTKFVSQLNEQVLSDGVHFERSLMYHKLILEGMIRIALVFREKGTMTPPALAEKIQTMLNAMCSLEKGMGKTPYFNDSADGVAKDCETLRLACEVLFGYRAEDTITSFPNAGYYKLYSPNYKAAVIVDAGMPGPSYMLGHAHCDALSYEFSYNNTPIVSNSGTYAYQTNMRSFFRGTRAHNVPQVDACEQMQCWSEHRVAGCYKKCFARMATERSIEAVLELSNGMVIRRKIDLSNDQLVICDKCAGRNGRILNSFVHTRHERLSDFIDADCGMDISPTPMSCCFGELSQGVELHFSSADALSYKICFSEIEELS